MIEITKEAFDEIVSSDEITVVMFYADGCKPCALMKNTLESLEIDFLDILFCRMPASQSDDHIPGAPTTIVYRNGQRLGMLIGAKDKETTKKFLEECPGDSLN